MGIAKLFKRRRDDTVPAHKGTPTAQPVPETGQGPLKTGNTVNLEPDDIVIAVMGPTGAGKSTFISSASGGDTSGVGHTLKSYTNQVSAIKFWDQTSRRPVVLVDTPGFDDTSKSDLDILNMISNWLVSSYNNKKLLTGLLYLHRITDNRMAGTPLKNLRVFRKLCGKDALDSVYLTTTMWDEVDEDVGQKRLDQLKTEYWRTMIDQGAQIACCRSDNDSPKQLIQRIICPEKSKRNDVAQETASKHQPLAEASCSHPLDTEQQTQMDDGSVQTVPAPEVVEKTTRNLDVDDIVVAVMGPTSSGKSTFIRCASGCEDHGASHASKSFTSDIVAVRFWDQESGRFVVLVDTPGFDDTFRSDLDIMNLVSDWLTSSYSKRKLLSGILYLHTITDDHVTDSWMMGTSLKNLRVFRRLCGKDALEKIYLTTTKWDQVDPATGETRLDELKTEHWKKMIDQGAQIACCRSDDNSPKQLIRRIIAQESPLKVLLIQQEMVELKKELKETAAGQELYSHMETLVEKQMDLLRRINRERKAASDAGILEELQTEYSDLRAQIDDKLRQMQELKLPLFKRLFSRRRD